MMGTKKSLGKRKVEKGGKLDRLIRKEVEGLHVRSRPSFCYLY